MNPRSFRSRSTAEMMTMVLTRCVVFYLLPASFYVLTYAYPPGWSDDILLTPEDSKNRQQCDIAVDEYHNVWAVWDSAAWVSGTAEILFTKRDSLGSCLIPETPVSSNATFSHLPKVAVDGSNNVHFIWRDASPQGEGIWHAKLANDGSVIVSAHLAVSGAGSGASTLYPDMAINKYNELYVIWDEYVSGYNRMNFTRLDSMGDPIIDKIEVSIAGIYAYWPGIGVDSFANAHMAYRSDSGFQDRLTYSKLDRNGNVLISNRFFGTGGLPTIIADRSQNMHIVYPDPAGPGISVEYLKLDQNGDILIGPLTLSVYQNNGRPDMAMDSLQHLHAVWDAESSSVFPIMYTELDTLGNFIIPPMQVAYPPYTPGGGWARIAVDLSNRLHLIWVDGRLNPGVTTDIFYKRGENEPGIEETNQSLPLKPLDITITPNPFRHTTTIRYMIHDPGYNEEALRNTNFQMRKPTLSISDAVGRLVKSFNLESSIMNRESVVSWDGKDSLGNNLPGGVYFLKFTAGTYSTTEKLLLIR